MTAAASQRIVLAAGGTGGHMFPARALARELLARGHKPVLITDRRGGGFGPELAEQVETHLVTAAGFAGGDPLAKGGSLLRLGLGYLQARRLLRRIAPATVVGFGGYASLPTVMAAAHLKRRVVLHEQNAVLGRANRLLAPRVQAIATSFPEVRGLREADQAKVVLTGNPVRGAFVAVGRKPYAVADERGPLRLLVTGGSQGARVFNDLIPRAVARLPEAMRHRLQVHQQVRGTDLEPVRDAYEGTGVQVELRAFFEDMPECLQAAHLVVCRAGASTVTELAAAGRPAILVPYPFAADDHQTANAEAFAKAGGGWVMPQDSLSDETLGERLAALFAAPSTLTRAADAARTFALPDSARRLAELAIGDGNGHSGDGRGTHRREVAA